jgi:hypothetical protein
MLLVLWGGFVLFDWLQRVKMINKYFGTLENQVCWEIIHDSTERMNDIFIALEGFFHFLVKKRKL